MFVTRYPVSFLIFNIPFVPAQSFAEQMTWFDLFFVTNDLQLTPRYKRGSGATSRTQT